MNLPAHLRACISDDTQFVELPDPVRLESGECLENVVVAYRSWGDVANAAERAILICHALTGSADVEAWWPDIIGSGRAFDPAKDFIVCANILGVGQRFDRELSRGATIERSLVVKQIYHHPDVRSGQHQDQGIAFEEMIPSSLQMRR